MVARGKKPTARGWSHAIAAVIALVFSIAMAMKTSANVEHMLSVVVFGASMVLLFSMSAVYHMGRYSDGVRLMLRAIDLCLLKTSSRARLSTFPRFGTSSPPLMIHLVYALLATARSSLRSRRELALENLALRQQLAVLKRSSKRPKLAKMDRASWVALSRLWTNWPHALILENPETVIGWHRKGFKLLSCPQPRFASCMCLSCSSMSAEVGHPRPGQDLWRSLRSSSACAGNRTDPHRAAFPVAESVLRARDWDPSAGMPGPRHRPPNGRRTASSLHATRCLASVLVPCGVGHEGDVRALRGAQADAVPGARMLSRWQRR